MMQMCKPRGTRHHHCVLENPTKLLASGTTACGLENSKILKNSRFRWQIQF